MSEQRASVEIIALTVEEAIEKGLVELGLPEDAVEVEVLDVGSKGLFGLGSRQARVRLTPKGSPGSAIQSMTIEQEVDAQGEGADYEPIPASKELPVQVAPGGIAELEAWEADFGEAEELALHVARETVLDLLQRMNVEAQVTAKYAKPDEPHGKPTLWVDVHGKDLSILIGPHAETLNAFQYITSLIVNKELGKNIPLAVDVEGYRQRRAQEVRRVARRMADQAVKTGRRQVLEPMPASERRLVHIELRDNELVTTESIGEEPRRKVTIIPK